MEALTRRLNDWMANPQSVEAVREACPVHVVMHGGMGFVFGGFLGMFMASMSAAGTAPEARLFAGSDLNASVSLPLRTQVRIALSDLVGKSWNSAKNFGKIAAIFSAAECTIESVKCVQTCR